MPVDDWDALEPTAGTPANAHELAVDVFIGAAWVNIPDITAVNPQPQPQTRNRSTYAAKGQPRPYTFARGMQLGFNVEAVRDGSNQFQEELQYLLDKAALLNDDNKVTLRFFDALGADYAYSAEWTIEHSRPNTGDTDPGFFGFTLTATSTPTQISNPVDDAIAPQIISITTVGGGVPGTGDQVLIHGLALTGATAVDFGGEAGTGVGVVDDRNAVATLPSDDAGSIAVTITTPDGTSAALTITRGA